MLQPLPCQPLVLIVAKCNVNEKSEEEIRNEAKVLIAAKCNVNVSAFTVLLGRDRVLIVAKCNVNSEQECYF